MKNKLKLAAVVFVLVFVAIQFKPVERTNPPVISEIAAPAEVKAILKRACYDCHSNETVWPWYSRVAPVSWLVAEDVEHARHHLNFSEWDSLTPEFQAKALHEMIEEVEEGEMPLWYYVIMHSEAKLSEEDITFLKNWVASQTH